MSAVSGRYAQGRRTRSLRDELLSAAARDQSPFRRPNAQNLHPAGRSPKQSVMQTLFGLTRYSPKGSHGSKPART